MTRSRVGIGTVGVGVRWCREGMGWVGTWAWNGGLGKEWEGGGGKEGGWVECREQLGLVGFRVGRVMVGRGRSG